jgi:hypothetical protein
LVHFTHIDSLDRACACCVALFEFSQRVLTASNYLAYHRGSAPPAAGAILEIGRTCNPHRLFA